MFVVGRRGGKSRALSCWPTYIAALCEHRLAPGERGLVLIVAQNQRAARIILDYAAALLRVVAAAAVAGGRAQRQRHRAEGRRRAGSALAELPGGARLHAAGRHRDEVAYWWSEDSYANPDVEVLAAIRPGLLTTQGPLVLASSPYARRGALWDNFNRHYGPDGAPDLLVAHGSHPRLSIPPCRRPGSSTSWSATARATLPSTLPNFAPTSRASLRSKWSRPPRRLSRAAAGRRYALSRFRRSGRRLRRRFVHCCYCSSRPRQQLRRHRCRARTQAAVLARGRRRRVRGLLKSYRITAVSGDRFAGGFAAEAFKQHGIRYSPSAKPKSDLYLDLLPLLNTGSVVLPKHDRLLAQLVALERRTARSGKDSIDHGPGAHDDVANAVAGAALLARKPGYDSSLDWVFGSLAATDAMPGSRRRRNYRGRAHWLGQ